MKSQAESFPAHYTKEAEVFGALSHPLRLQILELLNDQELTGTALLEKLEIPKANLFQHLNVLKDAGLLKARREGTCQYLSLAMPDILRAIAVFGKVIESGAVKADRKLGKTGRAS
jgi:ArsR family transcriptional regulator